MTRAGLCIKTRIVFRRGGGFKNVEVASRDERRRTVTRLLTSTRITARIGFSEHLLVETYGGGGGGDTGIRGRPGPAY